MLHADLAQLIAQRQQIFVAVEMARAEQGIRFCYHRAVRRDLRLGGVQQVWRVGDDVQMHRSAIVQRDAAIMLPGEDRRIDQDVQ
jgi:hypothetical protein